MSSPTYTALVISRIFLFENSVISFSQIHVWCCSFWYTVCEAQSIPLLLLIFKLWYHNSISKNIQFLLNYLRKSESRTRPHSLNCISAVASLNDWPNGSSVSRGDELKMSFKQPSRAHGFSLWLKARTKPSLCAPPGFARHPWGEAQRNVVFVIIGVQLSTTFFHIQCE